MLAKVRKAVFPAAGLGTRFLPATKAMPKEMLNVVDKPIIQYGVEEAVDSGIHNIIIVTGRDKAPMENHFDIGFELETNLRNRNKMELLDTAHKISELADVAYIRQKEPLGLGHAVLKTAELVGDEPFAVILPDDLIDAEVPCVKQLVRIYEQFNATVLAVMEVPPDQISSYGCIDAEPVEFEGSHDRLFRVRHMVEKPKRDEAPSNLAIIGRYILTPDIFDCIRKVTPGAGGEIQLTDAIKMQLDGGHVYAYKFDGKRYDAGDKLGFLKATVELGLKHPTLGAAFGEYLRGLQF